MPPDAAGVMAAEREGGVHVPARENNAPRYKRLDGKVAIVTGGAGGIGEATTRLFARHGAKVIVADIDDVAGHRLVSSLSSFLVTFAHCDVSEESDVQRLVDTAVSKYGRVDIFFNNAGMLGSQREGGKSIAELDCGELDCVMRVNVRGGALGMKHAARAMLPRRSGCIISTASVAGVLGGLGPHAYTASKHAIIGLTKSAACELGKHRIRVNCISPFGVATPMLLAAWREEGEENEEGGLKGDRVPKREEEEVERVEEMMRGLANLKGLTLRAGDIAEAALFLASDESKYISGHNLVVDGGVTTSRNCIGL